MFDVDRKIVEQVKREYPAGTWVKLVKLGDGPSSPAYGTVRGVYDMGNLLMSWDSNAFDAVYIEDRIER